MTPNVRPPLPNDVRADAAAVPTATVRPCSAADASTLAFVGAGTLLEWFAGVVPGQALLAHCHKLHTAAAYTELLARSGTRAWLAEVEPGAAPVGYALLTAPDFPDGIAREGDAELRRIYVFSRFHGSGAGRMLLERVIAAAHDSGARRLLLGVHEANARAIAFYRKSGFVDAGTRPFVVGATTFEDPVLALTL